MERLADQAALTIANRLDAYAAVLQATAVMFSTDDDVTATEFAAYVRDIGLSRHNPGMENIGYAVWLGPGAPPEAAEYVRRRLPPNVHPWPGDAARSALIYLQPGGPRPGNWQAAYGYDMWHEPVRRAALVRARDTGAPAVSGVIGLVVATQDAERRGFLMVAPVYRHGGTPPDVAGRRAALIGWVSSPFHAGELFRRTLAGETLLEEASVEVHDGGPHGATLYRSHPGVAATGPYAAQRVVDAAGRPWLVGVRPLSPEPPWSLSRRAVPILLTGLALTAAFAWAAEAQARALENETGARRQEAQARRQSDTLLKEVNHRVANSLQLVGAMVSMQAEAVGPPADQALRDAGARILAVGRVHRRLYQSASVERIELGDYLKNLVEELARSLEGEDQRLATDIAVEVAVTPDKAVAAGVVVAELVTNAEKYAYAPGEPGEIRVCLRRRGEAVELSVEDHGVGFAPGTAPKGTGLGMKVVQAMAATLSAEIATDSGASGTRVMLTFRAD